ncbi:MULTISPECIES: hypothetical protein [unclassified Ruegeria]|uniref:hypothetical protein n=1 Tax=unclassified Ruegeria TaxID=2625375 RepID=UPI001AD9C959|nr:MULTISPECIES: hypothetical protein [unclassified Ruegeria]MBO9412471.1 hypothetical protein [Ruegeria sp. R8_1]MBO9416291.1 hypothetical protein [Ruegeria sp. R8_2]
MSESLLSFSEVLLFGRGVDDLQIKKDYETVRVAYVDNEINALPTIGNKIDDVRLKEGNKVLVQVDNEAISGIYKATEDTNNAGSFILSDREVLGKGQFVLVRKGDDFRRTFWKQTLKNNRGSQNQFFESKGKRRRGRGVNNFLGDQFLNGARFAKIFGFSYEGVYYELPEPTMFLVHGRGEAVNRKGTEQNAPGGLASRAPNKPDLTGVATADYQFADDIRVWDYNKADFTIRMDVMSGQFEQVLLDIYFGFDSPAISGAKVSGAKVSGAKVSGAKVSGAKVSGAKVSGAKVRGGD